MSGRKDIFRNLVQNLCLRYRGIKYLICVYSTKSFKLEDFDFSVLLKIQFLPFSKWRIIGEGWFLHSTLRILSH